MRVLVAADALGSLTSWRVGVALGEAWRKVGADVAVVPMGDAGAGAVSAIGEAEVTDAVYSARKDGLLSSAVASPRLVALGLEPVEPAVGLGERSSAPLGRALAEALPAREPGQRTIVVDLAWADACHDAGAGLLAALGATARRGALERGWRGLAGVADVDLSLPRARLDGVDLVGLIPQAAAGTRLLGLRGISAGRGHEHGVDLAETMAADAALEEWAAAVDPAAATQADAGACGGAAFGVLALGGRVATGPAFCAELSGADATLRRADLVVTACDAFDFHSRGGGVVAHLVERCSAAGVPLVVVANETLIGTREMRVFGVEAAYGLGLADPTEADLADACGPIARSWRW